MEETRKYDSEAALNLYAELEDSCQQLPDYRRAYQLLNRTFLTCLNQNTNYAGIRFGGPFAKTDYLLKEHHAPRRLQRSVNDARVRMRRMWQLGDADLEANYAYDLKAVCLLVNLVSRMPVPPVLEARFPLDRQQTHQLVKTECLRMIVNRWDDTYIYGDADVQGTNELKVFYGGKSSHSVYPDWDWSYLRELLNEGCQLNLVRPREHEGVLYPELMIWEPDYLVDISAISACFEDYGTTALNHLLNKIKPSSVTQPIVLGNLAGQFLDEALYLYPSDCTYAESVQQFFRRNAISLLTAGIDHDFHSQARAQKQNIQATLRQKLPELLRTDGIRFDCSEIMVEPSFFSEMLGLQGRMDFLQLGQKVLIEQKSGKAAFPETNPPREQQKHYVQLLLYMLLIRYNFRDNYETNNRELHPFLLYSKYPDGLLRMGFAPDLVFKAIKVRNEMVASEFDYSRDGLSILPDLTADSLNLNRVNGVLWQRYQKPQITQLLAPIHEASELERAYYLRFMKFLETEHVLAKVGNHTKENSGFADKWHSSLADKQLAGNIYCDLDLLSPDMTETGRVEQLVLGFARRADHEISNFRVSDIVILYPYADGEEPDARRTMVFRATIERIEAATITLNLRAAQVNANVFWYHGRRKWAIEHDFFESSFSSLYRGMHAFLSAPRQRRDLLLLQRPPATDKSLTLCGDYGTFNTLALKVKQACELFLIIGPPGTGKTSFGMLYTLQEELLSSDASVLLLSYTNRAVDEICGKLLDNRIDFIRVGGKFSCDEACRPFLLDSKVEQCATIDQLRQLIASTRVFVGTTSAFNSHISLFKLKQFGLAIIDEASQILEPHLVGLLGATADDGTSAIKKMVLVGDHKQLPAVVQQNEDESAVSDPILHDILLNNCRLSLFERLLKKYRDNPDVTYMLNRQGRMHHDIAQFPNTAFYQDKLLEVPLQHQTGVLPSVGNGTNGITDMLMTRRMAFVAVPATPQRASDKVNGNEARAIAATVAKIYELNSDCFDAQQTVGIIVPYRNQIAEIRLCIEQYGVPALSDITIDTVERYQGSQRDYIIYGFTIQRYDQLAFLTSNVFVEDQCIIDRKLNVAMTRAREHLLLFGNPLLLAKDPVFRRLMDFARERQSFFQVPPGDFIEGKFAVPEFNNP